MGQSTLWLKLWCRLIEFLLYHWHFDAHWLRFLFPLLHLSLSLISYFGTSILFHTNVVMYVKELPLKIIGVAQ